MARAADAVGAHLISLKGLFPALSDYRGLRRSWAKDLMSGLTVGVVALPLALGFGVASGAGAAAGLVTAIIAGLVAAIFGGSHVQVSGPTGAMTVVLLPVIAQYGVGMVPLLAIMAGVLVVLMALTAMGRSIEMIPLPVVEGFTFGIGIIIILQQLPLLLGTPKGEAESTLMSSWLTLTHTDWTAAVAPLLVAALVIALHVVGRRFLPRVPIALVAMFIGWRWLEQAIHAEQGLACGDAVDTEFYQGKLQAARYFLTWEVPGCHHELAILEARDDTCLNMQDAWF